jgi:uncharacterized protein (TIGR02145 family)
MKYLTAVCVLIVVLAQPGFGQDTVRVYAGWNIVGSLVDGAINDAFVSCPPGILSTAMYEYSPGAGYQSVDTLTKGVGYWVKASEDGVIIFGGSTCAGGGGGSCPASVAYEGGPYPTVQIGGQCWLAKNLNVGTMVTTTATQTDNGTLEKYCFDNIESNCTTYGGLYQWNEAMQYVTTPGTRGICPPGWHIPTYSEFLTLSSAVGGDGNALKAIGQGTGDGAGTNTSGFTALLAGYIQGNSGNSYSLGYNALVWGSTPIDALSAFHLHLTNLDSLINLNLNYQTYGFSVRCVED